VGQVHTRAPEEAAALLLLLVTAPADAATGDTLLLLRRRLLLRPRHQPAREGVHLVAVVAGHQGGVGVVRHHTHPRKVLVVLLLLQGSHQQVGVVLLHTLHMLLRWGPHTRRHSPHQEPRRVVEGRRSRSQGGRRGAGHHSLVEAPRSERGLLWVDSRAAQHSTAWQSVRYCMDTCGTG